MPAAAMLGIFFITLLAHSWYGPDIWYHLVWGRELIENGNWIPVPAVLFQQPIPANGYWLFQALIYLFYQVGEIYLVSLLFALLWIATALIWLNLSQMHRKPMGLVVAFAFAVCMQLRFEQRPEVFSYFFLSLMTWLAYQKRFAPLFIVQVLWANMHGYFVLGPLVATLVWFSRSRDWRKSSVLFIGLLLVTGITPFGFKVWESVLLYARLGRELRDLNHELFMPSIWPPYWPTTIFWLLWLVTLFLVVWRGMFRREPIALLALVGLVLSAQASRNIPLLFLLSPLLWRDLEWPARRPKLVHAANIALAVGAGVLAISVVSGRFHRFTTSLATFGIHLEWASYPIGVVDYLRARNFQGSIFTDSYDGAFVEFHLPGVKVAGDSYFSDATVTRQFFAAIKIPESLRQAQMRFGFDAFIINIENAEVMAELMSDPTWVVAYADSHRALFLPKEKYPNLSGDLSQFSFYTGQDLKHWAYEFGVVSWLAFGFLSDNPDLINKILIDLQAAPAIPRTAFNIALKYATEKNNREIIQNLAKVRTTF